MYMYSLYSISIYSLTVPNYWPFYNQQKVRSWRLDEGQVPHHLIHHVAEGWHMVGSLSRSGHQLGRGEVEEAERTLLLGEPMDSPNFLGKATPQGASQRMGNSGGF